MMAERILGNEFKALSEEPWVHIELKNDNLFNWDVALIVLNPDSLYYGGYFKAQMTFPKNYPYSPPDFKFLRPIFHPNIYKDGKLCISILHAPGEDEMSGESAAERWSPAQRVESVLISILSLLDDAEVSSPANVDAGVLLRKDKESYRKIVQKDVEQSKTDIPEGFVMPTQQVISKPEEEDGDEAFWYDSGDEGSFGGSDSDAEMTLDEDDEEQENTDDEEANEGVELEEEQVEVSHEEGSTTPVL